jgi:hypothetical protein
VEGGKQGNKGMDLGGGIGIFVNFGEKWKKKINEKINEKR